MKHSIIILSLFAILSGCQHLTEENIAARKKLKIQGLEYSEQAFIKAVRANDIVIVKLFLNSGLSSLSSGRVNLNR
jgi:hypothetical protein